MRLSWFRFLAYNCTFPILKTTPVIAVLTASFSRMMASEKKNDNEEEKCLILLKITCDQIFFYLMPSARFINTSSTNTKIKKTSILFWITWFLFEFSKYWLKTIHRICFLVEMKSSWLRPTLICKGLLFVRLYISVQHQPVFQRLLRYLLPTRCQQRIIRIFSIRKRGFLSNVKPDPVWHPSVELVNKDFLLENEEKSMIYFYVQKWKWKLPSNFCVRIHGKQRRNEINLSEDSIFLCIEEEIGDLRSRIDMKI